ncbi:hypothetical protein [Streptomyces sp. C]|uniref:hypothetical protein n=1 Tax=Streptomyces sp. C TaxID=253839 RepID=UPI0001B5472A|nr:hypothetical protein [Streptomyces sp. C]EFL14815.1 conserved hypothetical protein [Streptomyces sp. C]
MATLDLYSPPGNLQDLDEDGRKKWHAKISQFVDDAIEGPGPADGVLHDGPRPQFYNATKTATSDDAQDVPVRWTAFPRAVADASVSDTQAWELADSTRDVQDEYCEWSVSRNTEGKITRVTFTCEGPEYWVSIAENNRAKLLDLYRTHISPDVTDRDLFPDGETYEPRNVWNNSTSRGAMHLIQKSNTIEAEIQLAAAATIRRVIDGREYTAEDELIKCGKYGDASRNSDPLIGAGVNSLARQGADITLTDPVGLYLGDLATDGWETPDGSDPKSYWKYVRGDAEHPVRAVYEVPLDKGYTVGDITIGGRRIEYGGQIAEFITIQLTATACRFGESTAKPLTACRADAPAPAPEHAVSATAEPRHVRSARSLRTSGSA